MIDLHTHTTASDGILTPRALIDHAIERGVNVLAITDHDTIDGLAEAEAYSKDKKIEFVPGVEFSIAYDPGTFHLVALCIDYKEESLLKKLDLFAEKRSSRAQRMVEDLIAHNIKISMNEVLEEAAGGVLGKPHIARVLVKRGYAADFSSVFKNYLEEGLPGHVPKEKIVFEGAMDIIKKAGGIAILAHPASLEISDKNEFRKLLSELVAGGLVGIEVYSEINSPEQIQFYLELAKEFNLLVSGGSDFHGDKGERIGYYSKTNPVPVHLYSAIKTYHEKKLS